MLVQRIDRERARRVRRARDDVGLTAHFDDVGCMPATRPFRVIGMDRSTLEGGNRIVNISGLVERIGVDGNLNVLSLRYAKAAIDRRGGRAPILVELQADRASPYLVDEA